jgi:hypothetical protein
VRRVLSAILLVALLAACGGGDPDPAPSPTPDDSPTPDATPTPTPTPEPEIDLAPLTGLPVEDEDAHERPVLAVKIDNIRDAHPQTGVEHADLVMVELVEGATRLIAFFHSTDPGVIGPVRSGRFLEADLLPPFEPIFAISGANEQVYRELRAVLPEIYEERQTAGWFRERSRRAPHNLYVEASGLWEGREREPIEAFWEFEADAPDGGSAVASFTAVYPRAGSSSWDWDEAQERWLRTQNGVPHVSAADGERYGADTVVVVTMPATGNPARPVEPVGEGQAVVFRDGQQFDAVWRKDSRGEHILIETPDGRPFPIKPGQTWMELLPSNGSLNLPDAGETAE